MKHLHALYTLLFIFTAMSVMGSETRPILLLGHGSDTWKVGKTLTEGNIDAQIQRNWPDVKSYSAYSAVYLGESVQGIAQAPWNSDDFQAIKEYVVQGGTLVLSGDTAFQLFGNRQELEEEVSRFLGFQRFSLLPQGTPAFAKATVQFPGYSDTGIHPEWMRNTSLGASQLTTAKTVIEFSIAGEIFVGGTENSYGKGKVYFLAPTLHRIAGNGEIELGSYSHQGEWLLNKQGEAAKCFANFICSLMSALPAVSRLPVKLPAAITGGDSARVSLALRNSNVEFEVAKQVAPADFGKYALVYIGETLRHDKERKNWRSPESIKEVRRYLEEGGVVVTSGEIPLFLAGEKHDMGELAALFGFASFVFVKNSEIKEFFFTPQGESMRKKAELEPIGQQWSNRVNCCPEDISTAVVLGEFHTGSGNIPAFTVNRVGKGAVYWLATNPYRLVPDKNEILGDPDEYGIFVLNERGKAVAALQKLFIAVLETPQNIALRKDFPEKAEWGLLPLGTPGEIPAPKTFRHEVIYKEPPVLQDAFPLSKDGVAQAVIVVPSAKLQPLAGELRDSLAAITGATFEMVTTLPEKGNAIILFDEEKAHLAGEDLLDAGEDTAIAKTVGGQLFLGGKGMGPSLAVHYLLEKLGCRKLWPGKSGTVIPKIPTLYAPSLSMKSTPILSTRSIRFARQYYPRAAQSAARCNIDLRDHLEQTAAGTADFFAWHGIVSNREKGRKWAIGLSHSSKNNFYHRFGKSHPEYFALQSNGSRSQASSPNRYRLCHSNPNMIKQVAEDCIKAIEAAPGTKVVSIPLPDGGGTTFCMCRKCRELDPVNAVPERIPFLLGMTRQNVKYVALTDRVLAFSNAVAEIVTRKYPDIKVYMYVYSHYTSAPVKVKPHPSLLILVANMNYTKESIRQSHLQDMMKYASFPGTYFWRTNGLRGFYNTLAPQNYARKMFEDLELFKANLVIGTDIDCFEHHWAFKPLVYYALSKAHWNPDRLGYDAIADDFCKQGFGRAAQEMRTLFSILEETTDKAARQDGEYLEFFDENAIASLRSLLTKAKAKASNDQTVLERIDFIATGIEGGALSRKLFVARQQKNAPEYESLRRQYLRFIQKTAEDTPFALNPAAIGQYDDFVK